MRLGKKERAARKMDIAINLAAKERIARVGGPAGSYASMWDRMQPHGKTSINWEYRGRNATRIKRNQRTVAVA